MSCSQPVRVAQWIARLPPEQKVAGSTPASDTLFLSLCFEKSQFSSEKKREQSNKAPMAQWIRRLPTEQEIPGSSPGRSLSFYVATISSRMPRRAQKKGVVQIPLGRTLFFPLEKGEYRRSETPFFRVTAFLAEWLRRWT